MDPGKLYHDFMKPLSEQIHKNINIKLSSYKKVNEYFKYLSKEKNLITFSKAKGQNNDYITKFIICYNKIITHVKFQTKFNQDFEVGKFNKDLSKTLKFNSENNTHMIMSFYGYYDDVGLRALGCNYIRRANFIMFFFVDYFRYRHILKLKNEEMEKWTEEKVKALTYYEQAFIRICLLPNSLFYILF